MSVQMPALDRALLHNKVEEAERLWAQLSENDQEELRVNLSDNLAQKGGRMSVAMAGWLVRQGVAADSMVQLQNVGYKDWLSQALRAENKDLVRWLIQDQGIDPNRTLPSGGPLPLVEALRDEKWDMGELLLELGATLEATNLHGQTPLHWAAASYMVQAMVWLVTHGANPQAVDKANHVPAEMIPQDPGAHWRPDPTYEWLSACEEAPLEVRKNIPPAIQEEALIEKIGLKFQEKVPADWTEEEQQVEKALVDRGVLESSPQIIMVRPRRSP